MSDNLTQDAVAWLQSRNAPMTAYNLNNAVNFLRDNPDKRVGDSASATGKQGIEEQLLPAIERTERKPATKPATAPKGSKSDDEINNDQREALARANGVDTPPTPAPRGEGKPNADNNSVTQSGQPNGETAQAGAGQPASASDSAGPASRFMTDTGVGRALAKTLTPENIMMALMAMRGAAGPQIMKRPGVAARVEPNMNASAGSTDAAMTSRMGGAQFENVDPRLQSPMVEQMIADRAKMGKIRGEGTMPGGGGMRVPNTSRVQPGLPGVNRQRAQSELMNSIGLE